MDAFGGASSRARNEADTSCLVSDYPQPRLEPPLRREAEERARGHTTTTRCWTGGTRTPASSPRSGTATRPTRSTAAFSSRPTGAKTFGPVLGVRMAGPTDMVDMVDMVSPHSGLVDYWDDKSLITWFLNPEGREHVGSRGMVETCPTWGRKSGEWSAHFAFPASDPERLDERTIAPRLRQPPRLPYLEQVHRPHPGSARPRPAPSPSYRPSTRSLRQCHPWPLRAPQPLDLLPASRGRLGLGARSPNPTEISAHRTNTTNQAGGPRPPH